MAESKSFSIRAYNFSLTTLNRLIYSSLYSNAFYLILNNAVGSVLGFVFMVLMARKFAPDIVGIGSVLTAASGLISTLANLSLGTGMVRFVPEIKERAWQLVNSVFVVAAVTTTLGSLIYLAGVGAWSPALLAMQRSWLLAAGFVLTSVLSTVSGLMDSAFIAQRSCKFIFIKNVIGSLVRIPLPFIIFIGLGGYGIFFSFGLAAFIAMAIAFLWFVPVVYPGFRLSAHVEKQLLRKVIPFSFSNYLANLFTNAIGFIFPIMVLDILGAANAAYFYIPWLIASVIGTIPNSVSTSLFAEASHNPQRLARHLKRSLWLTMLLLFAGIGITELISGWLLGVFGPAYAAHGRDVLFWLLVENLPGTISAFYITVNQVRKKVRLIILQSFVTSALTIIMAYVLMERAGLTGIGIGYALANLVVALVVAVPLWRVAKQGERHPELGG